MTHHHNPLAQFELKTIVPLSIDGHDLSFTNSSMLMFIAVALVAWFFATSLRKQAVIPSRLQVSAELIYKMITDMLKQNVGDGGKPFIPIIFTTFMFILFCNLLGMIPYSFTATSHIIVTFTIASMIFLLVTIVGFAKHGLHFFSLFLPKGTPSFLAPLLIIIELFTFLARPVSLSLRLAANMIAGHVMLKVIAGFVITLMVFLKPLPLPLMVVLVGFEIFVAILQAYIFTILSCVYLNDAVNLH